MEPQPEPEDVIEDAYDFIDSLLKFPTSAVRVGDL
eukprot:SAG31_NODE_1634_length_7683_cov_10.287843_6_plen_35_part_00